ncbi:hypothetical protein M422DRAFT_247836 [Sphaerobolus stellatus SS14]|nr:hypothetical protein M422DRAFT_247836 [Sphaerobolus stellatus SS14]
MFSKTALVAFASSAILAAALPTEPVSQCNTGDAQCCNTVESASSSGAAALLGLLGVVLQDVTAQVGLGCTPISVIAISQGANCAQQPVCCTDNTFQGLVSDIGNPSTYDDLTPFTLGGHHSLPTIDRDVRKGDFVIVTFTVNSCTWKKMDKAKQHSSTSNGSSSPQKKAAEGYMKCISMNIQDIIVLEAGEDKAFEEEIVNDNETGDEPQLM